MTLSILYVDDEPDLREIAAMSLELDPDLSVRTAGSGQEALTMVENWTPNLVLLDLMMPGMDGPETHEALRGILGQQMKVVYITARAERSEHDRLMALGALGVIAKPFDPLALARQVREYAEA